ncbi:MAG: ACP S-malonyltransferase, partial [Planctomycetota bacterium]
MDRPLNAVIADSALAFRGFNVTNLGRTPELLQIEAYRDIVEDELERFSRVCGETVGRSVDLIEAVRSRREFCLAGYAQSLALVVAVEAAQLRLLREIHQINYADARLSFGYSLGELMALSCGGAFHAADLVRVPLAMAADCAAMADDVRMGVLFSRGPAIQEEHVQQLCAAVTAEGNGTIGVSAILSPNTYLLIGQHNSVARFRDVMGELLPRQSHLRFNSQRWPPLHTPIVRQRNIPDRSSLFLETIPGGAAPPCPAVVSLATGR